MKPTNPNTVNYTNQQADKIEQARWSEYAGFVTAVNRNPRIPQEFNVLPGPKSAEQHMHDGATLIKLAGGAKPDQIK